MAEAKTYQRPSDSVFTDSQWNTLMHLVNASVPSLTAEETAALKKDYYSYTKNPVDEAVLDAYCQESATDCAEFIEDINNAFNKDVPADKVKQFKLIMDILGTRPGSLLMTGYTTPLHLLPRSDVHAIMTGWANARLTPLKQIFKSINFLTRLMYHRDSAKANKAMGFPGYPFSDEARDNMEKVMAMKDRAPAFVFEDLVKLNTAIATSYSEDLSEMPLEVSTDILILGSGSGGGVVAANVAENLPGHQVMVVEKGYWFAKHELPQSEREGMQKMFEERSTVQTDDGGLNIVAGATWGGGSTINWSVSWQLQASQRQEWVDNHGLKFANSHKFQDCLDYVSDAMSVQTFQAHHHNPTNASTLQGSHKLGYRALAVPQNIKGDIDKHNRICGAFCHLGCRGGEHSEDEENGKQGTTKAFLPIARDHGAKFVQGFTVREIIFDNDGKAIGVKGQWKPSRDDPEGPSRDVFIKAKRVVVSAGTLNSPGILLRSGVKGYHVGRNLHVHPCVIVNARWKEETRPWEGGILTSVATEFDNIDGKGHGTRIEGMLMLPAIGLAYIPWYSALEYRQNILKFRHMTAHVLVNRDRDSGRVFLDPATGKNKIDYIVSEFDRKNLHEAVIGTCKMLHAAGAVEIFSPVSNGPIYRRPDNAEDDERVFDEYIAKVQALGLPMVDTTFGSAHQMGTCRMGTSPRNSVVDDHGRVWGKKNLYVADASLFPSCSGVNPMLTTMGLSEWVARGIVDDIKKEEDTESRARL